MLLSYDHYSTYVAASYRSRGSRFILAKQNYALTWTLSPFSQNGYEAPSVVTLQYKNDSVYFAETILSQLMPNGSGFGTFDAEQASWALEGDEGPASQPTSQKVAVNPISKDVQPGSILR